MVAISRGCVSAMTPLFIRRQFGQVVNKEWLGEKYCWQVARMFAVT